MPRSMVIGSISLIAMISLRNGMLKTLNGKECLNDLKKNLLFMIPQI